MKLWTVLASSALWFFAPLVSARETAEGADASSLGLDDVLEATERSFPLLRAAELEKEVAAADALSAEGGFDVSFRTRGSTTAVGYYEAVRVDTVVEKPTALWGTTAFVGWRFGSGSFAPYDEGQRTLEHGELRAGVLVPFWRNGPIDRRRAALERAELGLTVADLSVTEQRIQARRAAAHRYWAWVAAGERLRIAEELLENVQERDRALRVRVETGDLPEVELLDNSRALEQRRAQLAQARRGLEQAAIELSLFLRDSDGQPAPPPAAALPRSLPEPAPTPPISAEADRAAARSRRPEARRLALQIRQTEVDLELARNQLAPAIDFQLAASRDFGAPFAGRPDLSEPVLELGLVLDIPLQTRLTRGRIDAATALRAQLSEREKFARERIDADVLDATSALDRSRERIDSATREVNLAHELERGERIRFEQGDSTLLIVNIREQQTAEAELRRVDALLEFHRARADLEAARGD